MCTITIGRTVLWTKSGCRTAEGRVSLEHVRVQVWHGWSPPNVFMSSSRDLLHWEPAVRIVAVRHFPDRYTIRPCIYLSSAQADGGRLPTDMLLLAKQRDSREDRPYHLPYLRQDTPARLDRHALTALLQEEGRNTWYPTIIGDAGDRWCGQRARLYYGSMTSEGFHDCKFMGRDMVFFRQGEQGMQH